MVNRSTVENGTYTLLSDVTGTGFDDATATPGIDYYYKVRAAAGSYSSAWSTADAGWQALLAPTNCTASDGVIGKVTISWNTVDGATGYEVRRADSSGGSGTLLASPASSPYDDATAAPAVAYYYVVRAVSAGHTGPDSKEDSGYQGLDIPQGVTASKAEFTDKIVVTWSSAVAGATSYEVRRADSDSGPFTMIGTSTTLSYTDTTVAPGAMYYYEVFAFANGYYSAPSTYDVGVLRLAAPSGVAATDGTSTASIGVSWNAVDGAASYNVFRADSSLGPFNPVGTSTEVTFADSKAAAHVTYYYKASAFANGYAGDLSADPADSGWRRLPGPTGVVASDGTSTTSVTVSWAAVTGATSYNVYRGPASSGTDFTLLGSSTGTSTSYPDSTGTDDSAHPYYYKASAVVNGYESELSADPADSGYRKISSALGVSASDGTSATSISVSWKTLASATSYNVYRGPASSGLFTSIGSVTAPALSYADTTAGSHIYYYYKVSAIVSGNETDISADLADSGWRALPAPTGIGATTNNVSQVNVTWTAVSGADGYAVRRSADGGTSWTQIGTTTASPFADMNVPTPGVTYYYDVAATSLNSLVGLRGAKAGGYRAMATPTGLTASAGTYNYVRLSWTAVTGAASYQVYRAGTLIAQPTAAAYSDTPADPHLDYSYTVQSVGANGAVSGQSTAATGWYSLSALKSVTASMDTYVDHIRVTWTSVTNAQSYNLYRSTDQKTWTSVATGLAANGTYDDYTATRLTTWYYAVRAVRYSREGLWSNMPTGHDGSLTVGATTHYNLQDANDYIGGYNGYVYGGAKLVADRFARAGGAFEFNGTTATIYKIRPELANAAFTGGAATISIWLKSPLKVGVPDVCIFSCQAFRVYEYKGALYFQWLDAKLQRLSTAAVAITTDWTHFVVTFDGSHLLTYLNGTNKGTTTLPYPLKLDTTAVGMAAFAAIPDVNKLYWPGVIDALTIYNRVLAPEEIAALNKADENSLFK
jgi:fibronectin type 3 domain-containing protein